jgi:hypothetical protein
MDIAEGRNKHTREGVVVWDKNKPVPAKAKFRPERDVYVRHVFQEKGARGMAGGFEFSDTANGPVIGRVGTGFSHGLKQHMAQNPLLYEGLKAKIRSQVAPAEYAPRAPVFAGWHLDQPLPEGIKMAATLWQNVAQNAAWGAGLGAMFGGLGGAGREEGVMGGAWRGAKSGAVWGAALGAAGHALSGAKATGLFDRVPEALRAKVQGAARLARAGATPGERSAARRALEAMARKYGFGADIERLIKKATTVDSGK